jgi:hypothetical protein
MKVRITDVSVLFGIIYMLLCVRSMPNCDEFHKLYRSLEKKLEDHNIDGNVVLK